MAPVLAACVILVCYCASADAGGGTAARADSASEDWSGVDPARLDSTGVDWAIVDSTGVDSTITGAPAAGPSPDPTSVIDSPVLLDAESASGADRPNEFAVHQDRYLAAERRCLENGADQAALIIASEMLLAAESLALAGELGAAVEFVDEAIAELEAAVHPAPEASPGP